MLFGLRRILSSIAPRQCRTGWQRRQISSTDTFMSGTAGNYIEDMYAAYRQDPNSVHASWRSYFRSLDTGIPSMQAFTLPPTLAKTAPAMTENLTKEIEDHMKVQLLIRAHQVRGHLKARIDPLGIMQPNRDFSPAPELEPSYYGFTEADMNRSFQLGSGVLPAFCRDRSTMTLGEIFEALQSIYCGTIGFEYTHIPDRAQCDWLRARIEIPHPPEFSPEERLRIYDRLTWADSFERFVASKWPGEKRFGLEGAESLIPGMKALIDRVVEAGVDNVVIGMAHRGRLNVLTNVVRKPAESVFCEFSGVMGEASGFSGDVKYHLGMNYLRPTPSGRTVNLSLVANPSHLEAVDPVVLGKTRGLQFLRGDSDGRGDSAMAFLIHGDAAFAGQGIVYETMGLAELPSYRTGGTVHLIINNQIGFTTDPRFARSTPYCSDIAKTIAAPIFHVNADDVEAVVRCCLLAADWRTTFRQDVVVDLVCYRKHGHNEVDQPAFTQPRMYAAIAQKTPIHEIYRQYLLKYGTDNSDGAAIVSETEMDRIKSEIWEKLETTYQASKNYIPETKEWLTSNWNGFMSPKELQERVAPARPTGLPIEMLRKVGLAAAHIPDRVKPHPGVEKIMESRAKNIEKGEDLDMPTAESLAFGTLLIEGTHDVERGTFSQRHSVIHSQKDEGRYIPLANLDPKQAPFIVCNSSLSEFGVLGFELGYSLVSPDCLTLWEAQFGDFANSAQVMIDQFIASGERKWLQRSALTLLLPHGYDGAGPEHSNGRIERFLSLCDDHPLRPTPSDDADVRTRQAQDCNLQVVYPTTPANYFHVLRRQIHRDFRKPLIIFNSKSLLRHPMARSSLTEMGPETRFRKLIPEEDPTIVKYPERITRLVFCSGQIYYALVKARAANRLKNVAIARLEQLSPFPYDQFVKECDRYSRLESLIWCQEEPINLGMWNYVEPRMETALVRHSQHHRGKRSQYAGREPTAAVATGYKKQHLKEEYELLGQALLGKEELEPKMVENGTPVW